jgi:TonB family protein
MHARSLFACILTIVCIAAPAAQMPRDRLVTPKDKPMSAAEAALVARIAATPLEPGPRLGLAKLQEDAGRYDDAEATLMAAKAAIPASIPLLQGIAAYYNRQGEFDKTVSHLEDAARLDPSNPNGYHLVATYYHEKAAKDFKLPETQKRAYLEAGIAAEDTALTLQPDYVEALIYKNILLRLLAQIDSANRERLIAEADTLRARAMELQKRRETMRAPAATSPRATPAAQDMPYPQAPVRVGGNIPVPTKTRHVNPVYPPDALTARVQGVVICEIVIDPSGLVSHAKILRSIALLDAAAVEAVRQWEFTPTHLNGMAVPVIMTVTVNFSLQ